MLKVLCVILLSLLVDITITASLNDQSVNLNLETVIEFDDENMGRDIGVIEKLEVFLRRIRDELNKAKDDGQMERPQQQKRRPQQQKERPHQQKRRPQQQKKKRPYHPSSEKWHRDKTKKKLRSAKNVSAEPNILETFVNDLIMKAKPKKQVNTNRKPEKLRRRKKEKRKINKLIDEENKDYLQFRKFNEAIDVLKTEPQTTGDIFDLIERRSLDLEKENKKYTQNDINVEETPTGPGDNISTITFNYVADSKNISNIRKMEMPSENDARQMIEGAVANATNSSSQANMHNTPVVANNISVTTETYSNIEKVTKASEENVVGNNVETQLKTEPKNQPTKPERTIAVTEVSGAGTKAKTDKTLTSLYVTDLYHNSSQSPTESYLNVTESVKSNSNVSSNHTDNQNNVSNAEDLSKGKDKRQITGNVKRRTPVAPLPINLEYESDNLMKTTKSKEALTTKLTKYDFISKPTTRFSQSVE